MSSPDPGRRRDDPAAADRVVIRAKRRIDPVTGEVRPPASEQSDAGVAPAAETGEVPMVEASLLDERTADLQRLQAEYANYRKRAERERLAAGDLAVSRVLADLLPVLDDIDRAREHGDVDGPVKSIVEKLERQLESLGLRQFGTVGDEFDPSIHEAVLHDESDDVSRPTCTTVMRKGYQHNDRLLRPAMVGVTDPATPMTADAVTTSADPATTDAAESGTEDGSGT